MKILVAAVKTLEGSSVTYRVVLGAIIEEMRERYGVEPDSISASHWSKLRRGITGVTVDVLRRMFGAKRVLEILTLAEQGMVNLRRRGAEVVLEAGAEPVPDETVRRTAYNLVNPGHPG